MKPNKDYYELRLSADELRISISLSQEDRLTKTAKMITIVYVVCFPSMSKCRTLWTALFLNQPRRLFFNETITMHRV